MDQEKETKRQAERCRALAQRIVRELTPASIQVLGGSGALAEALEKAGAQLLPENAEQGTAALLVVEDPEWVDLPVLQCAQVLLVCTDASAMADCAKQLAAQGLYRDFEWKNRGKAQQTALFCRSAAVQDAQQLLAGYEMTLDDLRERMQQAERTGEEQTAQLERLRSDLSLSRSHEQDLEKTLNNVTSSTFWKMSWPLRYFVSKGRQLAHTFPPFVFLGQLRRVGISGVRAQAKAKKEYAKLFPGRTMRADRFASAELLVRQAADQPAAPRISIVVPLYNTPQNFLTEFLDSVENQTAHYWQLCLADASDDAHTYVGELVQMHVAANPRIRYGKIEYKGIAANTNAAARLAQGEYLAVAAHDDILAPHAIYCMGKELQKTGADFAYSDEALFRKSPKTAHVAHFKPDYAQEYLMACNYICHLAEFRKSLFDAIGGERPECDGAQDHDLFLRLIDAMQAKDANAAPLHIPQVLYYWRVHAASTSGGTEAKPYVVKAAQKAVADHLAATGRSGRVEEGIFPGTCHVQWELPEPEPLVSILIPNKDHVDDLEKCLISLYSKTQYEAFEVIVIENNSTDPATKAYYEKLPDRYANCRVVAYSGGFNFSRINNFGRKFANGKFILLLNNDIEIISGNWLTQMVAEASQPGVAACGAMLYYPDDTIQHAGIITGLGVYAGHSHKYHKRGGSGYMFRLATVQDYSACTAACLLVRTSAYDAVGGLDEAFTVAFNDVEY